jgi:hypothetical protein
MYSGRISRLGGISQRTIIENNSWHWKIPRSLAASSFSTLAANYQPPGENVKEKQALLP